jgi:hypothetical protein
MNELKFFILNGNEWKKLESTPENVMNYKHVILYNNVNGFFQPIGIGLY